MPSEKGRYTDVFLAALVVEDRRVRAHPGRRGSLGVLGRYAVQHLRLCAGCNRGRGLPSSRFLMPRGRHRTTGRTPVNDVETGRLGEAGDGGALAYRDSYPTRRCGIAVAIIAPSSCIPKLFPNLARTGTHPGRHQSAQWAASGRNDGRDHTVAVGDIISEYPGDITGICTIRSRALTATSNDFTKGLGVQESITLLANDMGNDAAC